MSSSSSSFFIYLFKVSLSAQEANQFLSRPRRANQVFEETKQGHLERECVEERCTKEEAREVFENDPETVSVPTRLNYSTKAPLKVGFLQSRFRAGPPHHHYPPPPKHIIILQHHTRLFPPQALQYPTLTDVSYNMIIKTPLPGETLCCSHFTFVNCSASVHLLHHVHSDSHLMTAN